MEKCLKWTSCCLVEADLFTVKQLEKLQLACLRVCIKMSLYTDELYGILVLWN